MHVRPYLSPEHRPSNASLPLSTQPYIRLVRLSSRPVLIRPHLNLLFEIHRRHAWTTPITPHDSRGAGELPANAKP